MHCAVIYCISAADCRLLPSAAGRSISPCSRCQGFTYEHALLRERVSNFCATCSAGTTLAAPVAVSKLSTIANFESCVFLANQSPLCSAMRVACCLMTLNMHYSQKKSGANLTRGSDQNFPELRSRVKVVLSYCICELHVVHTLPCHCPRLHISPLCKIVAQTCLRFPKLSFGSPGQRLATMH